MAGILCKPLTLSKYSHVPSSSSTVKIGGVPTTTVCCNSSFGRREMIKLCYFYRFSDSVFFPPICIFIVLSVFSLFLFIPIFHREMGKNGTVKLIFEETVFNVRIWIMTWLLWGKSQGEVNFLLILFCQRMSIFFFFLLPQLLSFFKRL